MPQKLKPYTFKPTQGGALVTVTSLENVGENNYRAKTNWRRLDEDKECLREGDLALRPNASIPQGAQALLASAKITMLAEGVRPNGDRSLVAATATTIYRYVYNTGTWETIGSGFSAAAQRWQVEDLNGYLILNNAVDLTVTFRVEDSAVVPIYGLRESGVASVGLIAVFNGFLFCHDITEIQAAQLAGVMNGMTPYGLVAANLTNRIRYKSIWSEFGEPRRWAVQVPATMASAGYAATLAYPVSAETLAVGMKIAVIGAYVNGGTLGGQPPFDDGLPVATLSGTALTWSGMASNSDLSYPLAVTVTRFSDLSSLSAGKEIQDDSSGILNSAVLGKVLVIYRETSIFIARYTGQYAAPFVFTKVEIPEGASDRMLFYRWTLCNPTGDYHLFAGEKEFYTFDGLGEPKPAKLLNLARNLFFSNASPAQQDNLFAFRNNLTREIWFCTPANVLAFEYQYGSCSNIDTVYTAGAFIRRPSGTERWVVMAAQTGESEWSVLQYGLVNTTVLTLRRRGVAYDCTLTGGLIVMDDLLNEKDLRAYMVQLATQSANVAITVKLYATDDPAIAPALLFTKNRAAIKGKSLFEVMYRNGFFQDEIIVDTTQDLMAMLTARVFSIRPVNTRGFQRIAE